MGIRFPPFNGIVLYLPHCVNNETYNFCDAVCAGLQFGEPETGDCEGCSNDCSAVFSPVCSLDQEIIYPNSCHAACAGVQFKDCEGVNTIIPGKSPLPPTHLLPERLQGFQPKEAAPENF
ncbi:uncharacterized protein LOC111704115 [Eurytemora carolleeae]|uniref:uncharacterized protein LOC111704115 n=1 Tax=Eurytemora carolleeae TaxID=1294199 RepID=UPI000C770866|nr:uncharacterized protein LOC111704115 [Eurytemora carolleeae]|eukprot:XP_023332019.1 uncharacterized protein LOC111704115 [Eurytemora affinis]